MSWQDIQRDLLAASTTRGGALVRIATHPGTDATEVEASLDDLVRWIDENFTPKLTLRREDMVLLPEPPDPVARDHARLEALLSENAETIASFSKDAESAIRVVAMMIGMDGAR